MAMEEDTTEQEAFPFSDDVFGKKSDAGIKSHLEDLAKKHPEFAGDLKCPPWGGTHSVDKSWENARTIPVSVEKSETTATNGHCQPTNEQQPQNEPLESTSNHQPSESQSKDNLNQHGLRNTVDFVEQVHKSNQKSDNEPKRSSSAPPETPVLNGLQQLTERVEDMNKQEPKRFMSKIEITPVNPYEQQPPAASEQQRSNEDTNNQSNVRQIPVVPTNVPIGTELGSPRMGRHMNGGGPSRDIPVISERTQQQQNRGYESPQSSRKQPQVRHIPIYVEGRSDPVVTRSVPAEFEQMQNQSEQAAPLKRKFDNGSNLSAQSGNGPVKQNQPQGCQPQNQPTEGPNPSEVPLSSASDRPVTPTPPKPLDPMERIQQVQEDVNALTAQVEQFSGTSRADKEYLYLDEMLTRNLIKLDTIEVEGNEKLRMARKNAIKSIQKSISTLESKVPSPNTEEPLLTTTEEGTEQPKVEENAVSNAMEVDSTSAQNKSPEKPSGKDKKNDKKKKETKK